MYNQREIVIIPFPFTDLKNSKPRPAVIVSNQTVNQTSDVIVVQITSNLHTDIFSFPILDDNVSKKLILKSEVRCHKIFTISEKLISKKISELDEDTFDRLLTKIKLLISK
ncbi:MAG: type II toxin-antitoxin system PemK/MazF family toxin [Ignavibacteria bacterium]